MDEAFGLTKVRTNKELVNLALQELIRSRKHKDMISLAGHIRWHKTSERTALLTEF